MWFFKVMCMDNTNQFDTNTCHHNREIELDNNQTLHLFWDFPKSLINEHSDESFVQVWTYIELST